MPMMIVVVFVMALPFLLLLALWNAVEEFFERIWKSLRLTPPEVYGPPAPVRPKNPYEKSGPLAEAWNHGFQTRIQGGWRSGSYAFNEGRDAAQQYMDSGLARFDQMRRFERYAKEEHPSQ